MITGEELMNEMQNEKESCFKLADVMSLFSNGTAKIKFDGEEIESEKQYSYLDSYAPTEGDRVLLGKISGTYIILGRVNYNISPRAEEEIDRYLFDLKKVLIEQGLEIQGNTSAEEISATKIDVSGQVTANEVYTANFTSTTSETGNTTAGNLSVGGTLYHSGSSVGFFGKAPVSKRTLSPFTNPSTFTLQDAYTGINNIVNAFKQYNLL